VSDSSSSYDIKITTTGDPKGAQAVAGSLDKVAASANKGAGAFGEHGKAAEEAGGLVDQFGRRGSAAHDVVEGLTAASEGGVRGLLGLAKAAYNAKEALAISSVGLGFGVLLGLGPVFLDMAKKMAGLGDETEKAGNKAQAAEDHFSDLAEAAGKLGAAVGKSEADALTAFLKNLETEADFALKKLQAIAKIRDELLKEKTALAIDQVKAGPGTEAEKAAQIASIQRTSGTAASANRIGDLNSQTTAAREVADREQRTYENAAKIVEAQRQIAAALTAEYAMRARIAEETETQQNIINKAALFADENGNLPPEIAAQRDEAQAKLNQASAALKGTRSSDQIAGDLAEAQEKIDKLAAVLDALGKAAVAARKKADEIRDLNEIEIGGIKAVAPVEAQRAEIATKQAIAEAARKDAEAAANARAAEEKRIADEARRVAALAPSLFQPRTFTPDAFDSPAKNQAGAEALAARNSAQESLIAAASKALQDAASNLGKGENEAAALAQFQAALTAFIQAANAKQSATIQALQRAVQQLQSQFANSERRGT